MPIQVQAPDGSIAQFPDGMADSDIEAVMRREYAQQPAAASSAPSQEMDPESGGFIPKTSAGGFASGELENASWKTFLKGVPLIGSFVKDDPATQYLKKEAPTAAGLQQTAAGIASMAPVTAAAPGLMGASSTMSMPGRMLASGLSSGAITTADTALRGGDTWQSMQNGAIATALGAGLVPAFSAASVPVEKASSWLMQRFNPLIKGDTLTAAGEALAREHGLDTANLTPVQKKLFANADDKAAAATKLQASNEFGIEATTGQASKDVQQLHSEEQMRRGLMGGEAKSIMQAFDEAQKGAIAGGTSQIGSQIAPDIVSNDKQALGNTVRQSIEEALAASKQKQNAAWDNIGPLYASDPAKAVLPPFIQEAAKGANVSIDPQLTPASAKMVSMLEDYRNGVPLRDAMPIMGEEPPTVPHIDEVRRKLLALSQSSANPSDSRAARALYRGFNDWAESIAVAPKGLTAGDPADVARLVSARKLTQEEKALFSPTNQAGQSTPGGKVLSKVFDASTSPEEVISNLVGGMPGSRNVPGGQFEALGNMKTILTKGAPTDAERAALESAAASGDSAASKRLDSENVRRDAWNAIRLAYWSNLTSRSTGATAELPGNISTRISKAFTNQKSVLDTLYTAAEQAKMQAYRDAIDRTTYKPPNASGSSYGMQQKPKDSLMADMVKDAGMHVLSGGNAVVSAMRSLGGLAQRFTTTEAERLGSEGAAAAKRAVNQDIPGRQPYPYGRYGIAPTTQAIMRALGQ